MHDHEAGPDAAAAQGGADEIVRCLKDLLAQATPEQNTLVRYAALPHAIDPDVLGIVSHLPRATASLAALARAELLTGDDGGRYHIRADLRRLLLEEWLHVDVAGYQAAHAQLAAVLAERPAGGLVNSVELVYHRLGADDRQGLESFASTFEACLEADRPGLAERLLAYAGEHGPVLAPTTLTWLRYYGARLTLARGEGDLAEAPLRALLESQPEPNLEARIRLHLGQLLVATQRWSEAFGHFAAAEVVFARLGDTWNAARAAEAHGVALVNLAASLGGPAEAFLLAPVPRYRRLIDSLLHAPFLLYRWFSRHIPFFPNVYFGTDYQTWIVVRVMYRALERFKAAMRHLGRQTENSAVPAATMRLDLQIRIADLEHRVGEWARANRLFAALNQAVGREDDDYRWATLRLSEGRAQVAMGRSVAASSLLEQARAVFVEYGDPVEPGSHRCSAGNRGSSSSRHRCSRYVLPAKRGSCFGNRRPAVGNKRHGADRRVERPAACPAWLGRSDARAQ